MEVVHHSPDFISATEQAALNLHMGFQRCSAAVIAATTEFGSNSDITEACVQALESVSWRLRDPANPELTQAVVSLFAEQDEDSRIMALHLICSHLKTESIPVAFASRMLMQLAGDADDTVANEAIMGLIALSCTEEGQAADELTRQLFRSIPQARMQDPVAIWGPEPLPVPVLPSPPPMRPSLELIVSP